MTWDTYTVCLLGFRTPSSIATDSIVSRLNKTSYKLISAFPFLAGQIILENRTTTNSGTYRIAPYPPHEKSCIAIKDCSDLCASFDEIVSANAPFSMLPGDILSATQGMGYMYDYTSAMPVLVIQVNFLKGGVVLCFSSHHNALDMNGQGQMIKLFAAACRGEEFDERDVELGNRDEEWFLDGLGNGETGLGHGNMLRASILGGPAPPKPVGEPWWRYWRFSAERLKKLKALGTPATSTALGPADGTVEDRLKRWVSTNDALVAFYMQSLTRVRLNAGLIKGDDPIRVNRAADGRAKVNPPIPKQYMGHLVLTADTNFPSAKRMVDAPLSQIAVRLRESLNELSDYQVRSLKSLLEKTEDKSTVFYGAHHNPGRDFMITSWMGLGLYGTEFGDAFGQGNGKSSFVRRPELGPMPDLVYIMPVNREGDVDVGICLKEEEARLLKEDEGWAEVAQFLG